MASSTADDYEIMALDLHVEFRAHRLPPVYPCWPPLGPPILLSLLSQRRTPPSAAPLLQLLLHLETSGLVIPADVKKPFLLFLLAHLCQALSSGHLQPVVFIGPVYTEFLLQLTPIPGLRYGYISFLISSLQFFLLLNSYPPNTSPTHLLCCPPLVPLCYVLLYSI